MSEKTEEPTAQRLRRAQLDGDSAVSSALIQALVFISVLILAESALSALMVQSQQALSAILSEPPRLAAQRWLSIFLAGLSLITPLLGVAALTALCAGLLQTKGVISPKRLNPDLTRLNPASGLKNLLSAQRAFALLRSLITAGLLFWLTYRLIERALPAFAGSVGELGRALLLSAALVKRLLWISAGVALALAALDYGLTHFNWRKKLRMTKDEVKREYKESEGDPEIKAARKRAHEEALKGATLNAVRNATVLIMNPTHLAVALRYVESEQDAPEILAAGRGELAHQMAAAARAYGVPIVRDIPIARALIELEVGSEIPEDLYEAVAEILRAVLEETNEP